MTCMHLPHTFILAIASLGLCMATACHSRHPSSTSNDETASSSQIAAMAVEATLVEEGIDEDDSVSEIVMSCVRVTDAVGKVLLAPRIFAKVGQPASISLSTGSTSVEIQVSSRVEGDAVIVDAVLVEQGRTPRLSTTTEAGRVARPVEKPKGA